MSVRNTSVLHGKKILIQNPMGNISAIRFLSKMPPYLNFYVDFSPNDSSFFNGFRKRFFESMEKFSNTCHSWFQSKSWKRRCDVMIQ